VAFRDLKADFDQLGYAVVGISPDPIADLDAFKANNDLPFLFLSDERATYADRVGVWVEKSMYGRTFMGIARSTFVIGADGTVQGVHFNVKPQGHAEFVRDALAADRAGD
jgi:peroxiredoxin Q/BCP